MKANCVAVVTIRPLKIGDVVHRLDGQGAGTVTRNTKPSDAVARVEWGTGSESEVRLDMLAVEVGPEPVAAREVKNPLATKTPYHGEDDCG